MTAQALDAEALGILLDRLGREATRFRFEVAPNPCVGAAILARGEVIGIGYHETYGGPHAEIQAMEAARQSGIPECDWDTIAITLEPCSTTGKTPPCVEAILRTGIRNVVVSQLDPNPDHEGRGLRLLEAAGLQVRVMDGIARLKDVSPHFLRWMANERVRRPRPWMIAKWAQTMTGQMRPPADVGQGRWISSQESLEEVMLLRSKVEAIVAGVGTVLSDNPRYTVRPPGHADTPPARVILDAWLRTPLHSKLFDAPAEGEQAGPLYILCLPGSNAVRYRALEQAGATVVEIRGEDRKHLRLLDVQSWLAEMGFKRVLLETGPTLLRNYLDSGFVDQ
ncbi:MAG: bifunctional diaminohydroxyphosphoribosylaminopyrimidine deaminase/5-amino-6-(5-phosphoribosylamino)uracil reductase RibD, partial [Planctomycetes bacterium]|nr:bifunctional diaminohydroxyphosphoribosylaminopyrimidine deaminase/5-amino-6-(5-phosphoribosylamino)uracil reductase RibD [Planctomycetota bacterium]